MPGKFNSTDLLKHQKKLTLLMSDAIKKLLLKTSLDLSKHLAATSLDLLTTYIFANLENFCHVMASDGVRLLHLLAYMVNYDLAIYNKVLAKYSK